MEAKSKAAKKTVSREIENTKIWLEDLESEQDRMNDWEREFVENMFDAFAKYGSLTVNQYAKLEEIYERYF